MTNTIPKLNCFIPLADFDRPELLRSGGTVELWLPTEMVVYCPETVAPRVARVYQVPWWAHDGKVLSYEELRALPGFIGTGYHDGVLLWEIWHDNGSNRHVEYDHEGYVFWSSQDHPVPENRQYSRTVYMDARYPEETAR